MPVCNALHDEAQNVPFLHDFLFLWRHKMREMRGEVGKKIPKKKWRI